MSRIVGIDPGVSGALALHVDGKLTEVLDMPVYDGRTDPTGLSNILESWHPDATYIEHTQPMPRNGNIASFSLGMNSGIIIGVVGVDATPLRQSEARGLETEDGGDAQGQERPPRDRP